MKYDTATRIVQKMRKKINFKIVSPSVGSDGLLLVFLLGLIAPYSLCPKKMPTALKRKVNRSGYAADLIMSVPEIKLSPFSPNNP
jgi:hypothetical protein